MGRFASVLAVLLGSGVAGVASAQDWTPMSGAEITQTLSEKTFVYPKNITQTFYTSGRTLYTSGRPSWGYWEVRGDQYCSQWPPSDLWACYDMARMGTAIRFIGEQGDTTDAEPVAEQ